MAAHHTGPEVDLLLEEEEEEETGRRKVDGMGGKGKEEEEEKRRIEASLASTSSFVKRVFPSLSPLTSHVLTCLYSSTPDQDFVLGRVGGWVGGRKEEEEEEGLVGGRKEEEEGEEEEEEEEEGGCMWRLGLVGTGSNLRLLWVT